MEQRLAVYKHEDLKIFYVGVYNNNSKLNSSSSLPTNFSRAKYLHNQMLIDGSTQGLKSGFMIALINTDYEGWSIELLDEVYPDTITAAISKQQIVQDEQNFKFIGSDRLYVKGEIRGTGVIADASWTKKWSVERMDKRKIDKKIDLIVSSLDEEVPGNIKTAAYLAMVTPDGVRKRHNFGTYEINDLVNLFRFVRNFMGKDLVQPDPIQI
jgi:hypothetical protein